MTEADLARDFRKSGLPVLHSVKLERQTEHRAANPALNSARTGPLILLEAAAEPFLITWMIAIVSADRVARSAQTLTQWSVPATGSATDHYRTSSEHQTFLGSIDAETVRVFAEEVADPNPLHRSQKLARDLGFSDVIVPGALLGCLILIATRGLTLCSAPKITIRNRRWVTVDEPLILEETARRSVIMNAHGDRLITLRW